MNKESTIRVAISADFLKAFARIPGAKQKKVREFIDKFQNNPTSPGVNYERIHACKDHNLRSARIDNDFRAIVLAPSDGDVYMLLWVDKHDDAYSWAEQRRLSIHPETGGIQILLVDEQQAAVPDVEQASTFGLFDEYKDRQLRRLGVPDAMMSSVRAVASEQGLDSLQNILPQEAFESLYLLFSGFNYEEVVREYEREVQVDVDTENFSEALDNKDSQRRFKVIEDALEMQELLNAPLEQWRVFLHPVQRRFVELPANGPVRILGGAGTGKSVVAIHRAKWLVSHVFIKNNERILFTTYTRNLAHDIQKALRSLCSTEELKRIEVVNLDAWVAGYLKKNGYEAFIDFEGSKRNPLWSDALNMKPAEFDLSYAFFRDEWEQVIQAQGISCMQDYLKVSRAGRGRRMNRKMRKAVWPVFEEYRALLNENNIWEKEDAYRECRLLLEKQGDVLGYKSILIDEAQDLSAEAFKLLRQMIPPGAHDLFIVGDAHQRIYGHPVVMSQCGIKIQGRSRKLRLNYRTTEETCRYATAMLCNIPFDDLDGGQDNNVGYKSLTHGPTPVVNIAKSAAEEGDYILSIIRQLEAEHIPLETICLTARTHALIEEYSRRLEQNQIPYFEITAHSTDDQTQNGIRLATMHRVKGIEFDHVIIASANDSIIPLAAALDAQDNHQADQEAEAKERSLFYVALTRSRKSTFITAYGTPSPFLY
ncbi:MAG: DNA helicase [Verrucomicrobiae bacterium]|nr:DNA helicase [Verrucomicrobiae bacterium]